MRMPFAHLEEILSINCKILEHCFCLLFPLTKLHGIVEGQAWLARITFCLCFCTQDVCYCELLH